MNVITWFLFFSFCIFLSPQIFAGSLDLTQEESKLIRDYANSIPVEHGVGQFFMINLDVNYINSFDYKRWGKNVKDETPIHRLLINKEGFGSIILKRANFQHLNDQAETEEERMSLIKAFVSNLQYQSISEKKASLRIPLFVAVDFEGPYLNSLADALIPPPSALTLASTQDVSLVEKAGVIAGYQLAGSGINMILGPVLDIDNSSQGTTNTLIGNRSYSNDPVGVTDIATYYIKGLRQAGLTIIGKHFPGLGMVDGNPHFSIAEFSGNDLDLKNHLTPYYNLKPLLDGVMTSHVSIPIFEDGEITPTTFNKSAVKFIRDTTSSDNKKILNPMGYQDKLIISDDMGMGTITSYKKLLKNKTYAPLAIKAFEAGHDIIMFGKVVTDEKYKKEHKKTRGTISISQLIQVKAKLASYLKRPENIDKYKKRLHRIILAKAVSYKLHGGKIKTFTKGELNKITESSLLLPEYLKSPDGSINNKAIKKTYAEIIEKSYLLLSGKINDLERNKQQVACIFSKEKLHDNYRGISQEYRKLNINKNIHEMVLGRNLKKNNIFRNKASLKKATKKITSYIKSNKCTVNFYIADSYNSLKLISNIVISQARETTIKQVILLHITPVALSKQLLRVNNVVVMGAFTKHPISFITDVKIIKGDIQTNNKNLLTVAFQENTSSINIPKLNLSTDILGKSLTSVTKHDKEHKQQKRKIEHAQLTRKYESIKKKYERLTGRNKDNEVLISSLKKELKKVTYDLTCQKDKDTTVSSKGDSLLSKEKSLADQKRGSNIQPLSKNLSSKYHLLDFALWLLVLLTAVILYLNFSRDSREKILEAEGGILKYALIIFQSSKGSPKLIANVIIFFIVLFLALQWQKLI